MNEIVRAHIYEKDEERKKELVAKLENETIPNHLRIFEERVVKSGSGYLATSGLTWADLYLYAVLEWFGPKREPTLEHFPHLKKLNQAITEHPRIAAWLAKRPVTEM